MSGVEVAATSVDVARVRADFPILRRTVNGRPLVYLDSGATAQKPQQVLDAVDAYYHEHNANVHRGVHTLGNEATDVFENARERVARFIDAPADGLVFLRNTTEALNLVASSYARELLSPADRVGLTLGFLRVADDGNLDLSGLDELLAPPTRLLSISHQSNVLGTVVPLRMLIAAP